MILKLSELFIIKSNKQFYTKQELFTLKLSSNFINKMEAILNLTYLENSTSKGNLCFASNSDVQPEFKTFFTKMDLLLYINATLNNDNFDIKTDTIQLPINAVDFWKVVQKAL